MKIDIDDSLFDMVSNAYSIKYGYVPKNKNEELSLFTSYLVGELKNTIVDQETKKASNDAYDSKLNEIKSRGGF